MIEVAVGAATVDVTPSRRCDLVGYPRLGLDLPFAPPTMAGYVGRKRASGGVHDPLVCSVLVVDGGERIALIGVDTLYVGGEVVGMLRAAAEEAGVDAVLVCASHTHSAPDLAGIWDHDSVTVRETAERMAAALRRAVADLALAELTAGSVEIPYGTVNRAGPSQPIDRTLSVLAARRNSDLVAAFVTFACHPLMFDYSNEDVSADFVHYLRRAFRAVHPRAHVVFANGCAGNVNPEAYPYGSGRDVTGLTEGYPAYWGGEGEAERLGTLVAGYAIAAAAGGVTLEDGVVRGLRRDVSLPRRSDADLEDYARYLGIRREAVTALVAERQVRTEVTAVALGDHVVVGLPGEPFGALGLELRARIEALGATSVTVAGYTNGNVSYVLPDDALADERYERVATYLARGAAPRLVEAATEAAAAVLGS